MNYIIVYLNWYVVASDPRKWTTALISNLHSIYNKVFCYCPFISDCNLLNGNWWSFIGSVFFFFCDAKFVCESDFTMREPVSVIWWLKHNCKCHEFNYWLLCLAFGRPTWSNINLKFNSSCKLSNQHKHLMSIPISIAFISGCKLWSRLNVSNVFIVCSTANICRHALCAQYMEETNGMNEQRCEPLSMNIDNWVQYNFQNILISTHK